MLQEWIGREETADDEVPLNSARQMAALLNLDAQVYKRGSVIPAQWYVMLFTPTTPQSGLGPDGHAAKGQFLPPVTLPRRMFAGRRTWFHQPLVIGQEVRRVSRIESITPKTGRSGEMVFVTVRHEISAGGKLAVVEEQDIVYRQPAAPGAKPEAKEDAAPAETPEWTGSIEVTTPMLFRYSAITFNAHRIHYDLPYTQNTEGYPNLVVNGGLTTLMLWNFAAGQTGKVLKSSQSRNLKPLFVGQTLGLNARATGPNEVSAWATNAKGERCVEAKLELEGK
jgi:3-methylfumaryl-CoA hydratase